MTNTETEQLRECIEHILGNNVDEYGSMDEKIVEKFLALFQSHEAQIKQDIFKKVEGIIGEDIENVAIDPQKTFTQRMAQAHYQNEYKAELRSSLKALEEKEIK